MADLETLIVTKLRDDATLAALLAPADGGDPAIWVENAPMPGDERWDGADVYPRVVISVNRSTDPVKGLDGAVIVDIAAGPADVPVIEARIRDIMNWVFWHPTDEPTSVTRIVRVTTAPELTDTERGIDAVTQEYDLTLFPAMTTYSPDPIATLLGWAAARWPGQVQVDPSTWDAALNEPALYFTFQNVRLLKRWPKHHMWEARLRGHVISLDYATRLEWVRRVAEALTDWPNIQLEDGTWLRVDMPEEWDITADPLRTGQILAMAQFVQGKRRDTIAPPLTHVIIGGDVVMEVSDV